MKPIAHEGDTVIHLFNAQNDEVYTRTTHKSPYRMMQVCNRLMSHLPNGYSYRIDRVYHNSKYNKWTPSGCAKLT